MSKLLSWIVLVPVAVIVVVFSVSNRTPVTLDGWPFPYSIEIPVFAVILASLVVGVLWGGAAAWLSAGKSRRRAREQGRRAEAAERETKRLRQQLDALETETEADPGPASGLPVPRDAA